jgi:phage protein D/phage baseplate assembly protein gpV
MSQVFGLPQVTVEVDGMALPAATIKTLAEVRVQQRLSMPTLCELTFSDPPGPLDGAAQIQPGAALRVTVPRQTVPLFVGQITAIEHVHGPAHEQELRIRGYDLLHRLRKQQLVRAHVQVTLRDLAQDMVTDFGLAVVSVDDGPLWQRVIQHRQSNLELLVALAERCGLYLTIRDDALYIINLNGAGETVSLELGKSLLEARLEVNGDPAVRTVQAAGWDPGRMEVHSGQAGSARSGRSVSAEVTPDAVGGRGQRDLVDELAPDERHAEALAQAELDRGVAREVTLWGVADGDPRLRPGIPVDVTGVAAPVAGTYVLTSVTHTIDQRMGFVSEVSSTPPVPQERARAAAVTPAEVTAVDDPDGLGRIRVKLSAYEDTETEWMEVVVPGAGNGKGLVALPDVGDRVLLICAHEDPAEGVILGGVYGPGSPPDDGVQGGAIRRYTLRLPGGQYIQLDDEHKTIHLENSDGSVVELAPDKVRLHAATDLEIEAPGHKIVIRGQSIDFEKA